jgi:hypothetical protein
VATSRAQTPAVRNPYSRLDNRGRPVMDTESVEFQKTQLLHLENPAELQPGPLHHDTKLHSIQRKLAETGGIQNTLREMERSLQAFEINKQPLHLPLQDSKLVPPVLAEVLTRSKALRAQI